MFIIKRFYCRFRPLYCLVSTHHRYVPALFRLCIGLSTPSIGSFVYLAQQRGISLVCMTASLPNQIRLVYKRQNVFFLINCNVYILGSGYDVLV